MSSLVSRCQVIALLVLFFFGVCLAGKDIPANFVFGDSLVEVGNNNYLATLAKANNFPNGIDFGSPTGRFTNGRTIVDIISNTNGVKMLKAMMFGVNYLAPVFFKKMDGQTIAISSLSTLSRAANLYRQILAKEVAKAIAQDTTTDLPKASHGVSSSSVKEELRPKETYFCDFYGRPIVYPILTSARRVTWARKINYDINNM
ncbi:hypothetical protein [Arabidopsis thaliana]|nr:hypothetical protein [Arabidopsis thaliana]CAB78664.1 hypothetical protein [Arabidopsis thaliana]